MISLFGIIKGNIIEPKCALPGSGLIIVANHDELHVQDGNRQLLRHNNPLFISG